MSMTYRDEIARPLTSLEVDGNFRTLEDRVSTLGASIPDPQPPGIGEAPRDGRQYARQNAGWSVVVSSGGGSGGISHAPSDGNLYASSGGFWTAFAPGIPEAPNDGRIYGRQSRGWVVAPTGGGSAGPGIAHLGPWTAQLDVKLYNLVEKDAMTFISRGDYGTGTPPPSLSSDDYWLPLGLPSVFVTDAVTQRFYHQFTTAHRTTKNRVSDIINEFETRLKAAEDKLADHESRITALE